MATLDELPTEELPAQPPLPSCNRTSIIREVLIALAALIEAVELHRATGHGRSVAMTPADHRLYAVLADLEQPS